MGERGRKRFYFCIIKIAKHKVSERGRERVQRGVKLGCRAEGKVGEGERKVVHMLIEKVSKSEMGKGRRESEHGAFEMAPGRKREVGKRFWK